MGHVEERCNASRSSDPPGHEEEKGSRHWSLSWRGKLELRSVTSSQRRRCRCCVCGCLLAWRPTAPVRPHSARNGCNCCAETRVLFHLTSCSVGRPPTSAIKIRQQRSASTGMNDSIGMQRGHLEDHGARRRTVQCVKVV